MRFTFGISFLIYGYFSGQYFFVVLIVFLQKFRRVQFIWTFFHALATFQTVLNFFHFFLHLRSQPAGARLHGAA